MMIFVTKNGRTMILPKTYSDPEGSLVDGTGNASNRVGSVGAGRAFVHPLRSDLMMVMMTMMVVMVYV